MIFAATEFGVGGTLMINTLPVQLPAHLPPHLPPIAAAAKVAATGPSYTQTPQRGNTLKAGTP